MLKTKIHRISAIFSKQAPFYQNRVDFSDHAFWEKVTQAIENYQECVIIGREHPLQKRAHHPLLIAAGFHNTAISIPWLAHKRLQIGLG